METIGMAMTKGWQAGAAIGGRQTLRTTSGKKIDRQNNEAKVLNGCKVRHQS
jgi:hypothetical protein